MALTEIERAIQDFETATGQQVFKRANAAPEGIQAIADALKLEFPPQFREFYETYDYFSYGPEETLSPDEIVSMYHHIAKRSKSKDSRYLPFMPDGAGGYYVIVCRRVGGKDDSEFGCVMFLPSGRLHDMEFQNPTFAGFLISRMKFWQEI